MLIEIKDVKQVKNDGFRRWFTDQFFDLIVWFDEKKRISGFQLCYDKVHKERALTWRLKHGYSHTRIDDGESPGQNKMTPILVADGIFEKKEIAEKFKMESREIDPAVSSFVYGKVLEYTGEV